MKNFNFKQVFALLLALGLYFVWYYRYIWSCKVYRFNYHSIDEEATKYIECNAWISPDKYEMFEHGTGNVVQIKVNGKGYDKLEDIPKEIMTDEEKLKHTLMFDFLKKYPNLLEAKEDGRYLNLVSVAQYFYMVKNKEYTEQLYDFSYMDAKYYSEYEYFIFNELFGKRFTRDKDGEFLYRSGRCSVDYVQSEYSKNLLKYWIQKEDDSIKLKGLSVLFCPMYRMVLLVKVNTTQVGFELIAVHHYKQGFIYRNALGILTSFSPYYENGLLHKAFVGDQMDSKIDLFQDIRIKRYKTLRSKAGEKQG